MLLRDCEYAYCLYFYNIAVLRFGASRILNFQDQVPGRKLQYHRLIQLSRNAT